MFFTQEQVHTDYLLLKSFPWMLTFDQLSILLFIMETSRSQNRLKSEEEVIATKTVKESTDSTHSLSSFLMSELSGSHV